MSIGSPIPKVINQKVPNQIISLYRGQAELIDDKLRILGRVEVEIQWHPFPNISIKFMFDGKEDVSSYFKIRLLDLIPQRNMEVKYTGGIWYGTGKAELFGELRKPFIQGVTKNLHTITFSVVNFFWFDISNDDDFYYDEQDNEVDIQKERWLLFDGQFIFDYDNWHIVIGTLDSGWEREEKLEAQGGFAVTHICKIEHLDDTSIDNKVAREVIHAFCFYLSFIRGFWIAPLLLCGFDKDASQIFEEWGTPTIKADTWQSRGYSWTTPDTTECVSYFSGFMEKWKNEKWHGVIKDSIQWYIESAKHTNGHNTSIILVQAALEKLAWTYLSTNEYLTADGFKKLTFADKVRLMLKILGVEIIQLQPDSEITKFIKANNVKDNVDIIAQVRNHLIHPTVTKKQNQLEISETMIVETFEVAHYYSLKSLLKIFGFSN